MKLVDFKNNSLFDDLEEHIVRAFWEFHASDPNIFNLYLQFSREIKRTGRTRYGIVAITQRIRWHFDIQTSERDFKLNNNHQACYARLLILAYPDEFTGFFQIRKPVYKVRREFHRPAEQQAVLFSWDD